MRYCGCQELWEIWGLIRRIRCRLSSWGSLSQRERHSHVKQKECHASDITSNNWVLRKGTGFQKGKNRNQSRTWTFWDLRDGKITLSNLGQLETESFFRLEAWCMCVYTPTHKKKGLFFFLKKREKGTFPTPPCNLIPLSSFKNSLAHWLWHCCFSHPSSQDTWGFFFESPAGSVTGKRSQEEISRSEQSWTLLPKGVDGAPNLLTLGGILSRGHSHGTWFMYKYL